MYQKYYTRFLALLGSKIHFAAHSHHAWPDVSREAHLQYWDDSVRLIDDKWEYIFSTIIPHSQKKIAQILNLSDSSQIAFAPNTHELVSRLLSTFKPGKPIKILTTNNEFHSFRRQIDRMEEAEMVQVTKVNSDELATDPKNFIANLKQKLQTENYDLFFISQVFFDSGLVITTDDLIELTKAAPLHTLICIDGYHAFAAIPVDLSALEGRIFYLGGGYKYAQAGEGMCFMIIPKGEWRPINTGWFAEMESLSSAKNNQVSYAPNGGAFLGSTQDPSGFYRFNAVWDLFEAENITVEKIHAYVTVLQDLFLSKVSSTSLSKYKLLNDQKNRGHFLTFDLKSTKNCAAFSEALKQKGVFTDYRGQRLRIGFGIYQTKDDVLKLVSECSVVAAI